MRAASPIRVAQAWRRARAEPRQATAIPGDGLGRLIETEVAVRVPPLQFLNDEICFDLKDVEQQYPTVSTEDLGLHWKCKM